MAEKRARPVPIRERTASGRGRARNARTELARDERAAAEIGLTLGVIELAPAVKKRVGSSGAKYSVRLLSGERVQATLAPSVDPGFARECVRDGRMVIVAEGVIAGALQTQSHPATDARGNLALGAEHLRLSAKRSLHLEVPGGRIELEPGGVVKIESDRLVLDAAALVRILSSRVEVP
jgi:hypothetical protein